MGSCATATIAFGFEVGEVGCTPDFLKDFDGYFEDFAGEIEEQSGLEVDTFCTYECPGHFLYFEGTRESVDWGETFNLNLDWLKSNPDVETIAQARSWCLKYGVPWKEPKWTIYAMYG
jgi:hypothetical protein